MTPPFPEPIDLKAGTTFVDRHSDSYERWGDYFAIQNMYDSDGTLIPSEVWMSGFMGMDLNRIEPILPKSTVRTLLCHCIPTAAYYSLIQLLMATYLPCNLI